MAVNKTKKQEYEGNKKKFSFSNNVNHKKDRSCSVEEQYRKKKRWADCGNKLMEEEPKGTRNKVKKKVEKMLMTQTFCKIVFKKKKQEIRQCKTRKLGQTGKMS